MHAQPCAKMVSDLMGNSKVFSKATVKNGWALEVITSEGLSSG